MLFVNSNFFHELTQLEKNVLLVFLFVPLVLYFMHGELVQSRFLINDCFYLIHDSRVYFHFLLPFNSIRDLV